MITETTALHEDDTTEEAREDNSITFCIDDNKLRIYCGRLTRQSYEYLRANKFTATPKQSCDFVATWSLLGPSFSRNGNDPHDHSKRNDVQSSHGTWRRVLRLQRRPVSDHPDRQATEAAPGELGAIRTRVDH